MAWFTSIEFAIICLFRFSILSYFFFLPFSIHLWMYLFILFYFCQNSVYAAIFIPFLLFFSYFHIGFYRNSRDYCGQYVSKVATIDIRKIHGAVCTCVKSRKFIPSHWNHCSNIQFFFLLIFGFSIFFWLEFLSLFFVGIVALLVVSFLHFIRLLARLICLSPFESNDKSTNR